MIPASSPGCSSISSTSKSAPLAPAQVEPLQHLRPVLRLGAAGAGVDLEVGVGGVVLAGHLGGRARAGRAGARAGPRRLRSSSSSAGLPVARHLQQHLELVGRVAQGLRGRERLLQLGPAPHHARGRGPGRTRCRDPGPRRRPRPAARSATPRQRYPRRRSTRSISLSPLWISSSRMGTSQATGLGRPPAADRYANRKRRWVISCAEELKVERRKSKVPPPTRIGFEAAR